jgi:hypothetical protein
MKQNIYIILLICLLVSIINLILEKCTDIDLLIYGKSIYNVISVGLLVVVKICDMILAKLDKDNKKKK